MTKTEREEYRSILKTSLDEIEGTIDGTQMNSTPLNDEIINLKRILTHAREMILDNSKVLLTINEVPGVFSAMVGYKSELGFIFIFAKDFKDNYIQDKFYQQGTLIHEFQHLYDLVVYGPQNDKQRILSDSETRAFKTESSFFSLLDADIKDNNPCIKRLLQKISDAPNGPIWRDYLGRKYLSNLDMLDKFQMYQYHNLPKRHKDLEKVFTELIFSEGEKLKKELSEFNKDMKSNMDKIGETEYSNFINLIVKMRTFVIGSNEIIDALEPLKPFENETFKSKAQKWKELQEYFIESVFKLFEGSEVYSKYNEENYYQPLENTVCVPVKWFAVRNKVESDIKNAHEQLDGFFK